VWLSLPSPPPSIEWLERRGRRTRAVDIGTTAAPLEITRW
jgi:hypothetical protein